jgi:DNA-binding transcriptional LysR family regulator
VNLASIDLNLLVALEALVEERSVSRAARRIGLSQPAMSHALGRLRGLLDDTLLVRAAGGMQLTLRGEALRYPVKDALEKVKDLLQCEGFDPAVSARTFRIFVADNAADLLLPSLWAKLQHQAPKVRIEIQPWRGSGVAAHDLARGVDVAIGCMPGSFPGFYRQRLFTDRDACAARRGNPHLRGISRRARFLEAKHVAVIVHGMREDPVDTWLREEGCQRNVALTVPNYLQALHVVARSDLLAVIPERLIRAYARELKLRAKTVPLDVGTFEEYLLHPARTHGDPGCVWLRGVIKEIARPLALGGRRAP